MMIQFVLYAILLFFFIWALKRLVKMLPIVKNYQQTFFKIIPVMELALWLLLIFFFVRSFIKEAYYIEIVIFAAFIILIFFISWFFIKDFIAGIFIRSEYLMNLNQRIKVFDTEGHINKVSYRTMEIKSDTGEIVKIPYSKLSNAIISFPSTDTDSFYKHNFKIEIKKDKPYTHYLEYLRFTLLNTSWVTLSKDPDISLSETTETVYIFKIEFYALSEQHARRSELMLKKHFEE